MTTSKKSQYNDSLLKKKSNAGRIAGYAVLAAIIFIVAFGIYRSVTGDKNKGVEASRVTCVDDMAGSTIGVQLGTTGDTYVTDYEGDDAGTSIVRYNKGHDAVSSLKQGKIDCVLIDEQTAKAFVDKNSDLSILEEEFTIEDYAICVAKDNKELTEKINKALSELKEDGTLAGIIDYYINDGEAEVEPYKSPEGVSNDNGTLIMATNVAFPPYEFFENGKATGIDVDIATAICDKLGMKLEIANMEFDSVIIAVQSGKADFGAAGLTVTEDRLKNIDFTDSYATSKQVIIVRNGSSADEMSLKDRFVQSFIEDNRWEYIPKGLANTLIITLFAGIVGIIIGFIVAVIRVSYEHTEEKNLGIKIINLIAKIYLTIFRGTPMMVQLLIMYYVIFAAVKINPVHVSIIAFGINSGAYVSEAVRAGIISIPEGQFEAGRSLGFNYIKTMRFIIMPQAIKNALPAMCNEFIALLKETSIVGYIGLMDLTKSGDIIRSVTYEAMFPFVCVGAIYLVIVMILTSLVGKLERRLTKNAR